MLYVYSYSLQKNVATPRVADVEAADTADIIFLHILLRCVYHKHSPTLKYWQLSFWPTLRIFFFLVVSMKK